MMVIGPNTYRQWSTWVNDDEEQWLEDGGGTDHQRMKLVVDGIFNLKLNIETKNLLDRKLLENIC